MSKGRSGCGLPHLRALFAAGTATGLTDDELLERYRARRAESAEAATAAEAAFAALVDRHGPMVWGVCRRVLGDAHEAEDAFQATFLILVRKARSVRVDRSLGRWLYGVAHRVALRARSQARRRGAGIGRVPPAAPEDPAGVAERGDLRDAVGEELDRLPPKYRGPVELCHLQGMTYDQAALQLDWPVATVKSRLTRGRLRLRERLARRGLAPGAVALGMATALTAEARAAVPRDLIRSTARAAAVHLGGAPTAAVADLARGVLSMMMWEKLKIVAVGVVIAAGLTARALSWPAPQGAGLAASPPQAPAKPAENSDKPRGDRRWVRSAPCGALIEVVGVSPFPSGPETWWRPDGTPLRPAPCDPIKPNVSSDWGVPRLVLVRLARIPDGADSEWSVVEAGAAGDGPARRDGRPLPGLSVMTAFVRADAETCTVRFKVAAGPWTTIETWQKNAGGTARRFGPSTIFGGAIATRTGTAVAVTHDIQDRPVRVIAIDGDGKELAADFRSSSGVKDFQQLVVEFDQPPERIKEFRLQTRPYEVVEIPRVALKPR
jgi:RNA polymerase sigma factor (sigma-70 family)